jgi:ABC-type polar amino acid transport system ATPase subunit
MFLAKSIAQKAKRLGIDEQNGKAMSHRQLSKIRERVGMVFQSFNLWPHLTVQQNVSEALLHVKGMKRDEASAIAIQQLEKVGMAHKADAWRISRRKLSLGASIGCMVAAGGGRGQRGAPAGCRSQPGWA